MAITRAQQAKQLLAQGGRTGFRMGSDEGDVSGREYGADTAASRSVRTSPSRNVTISGNDEGGGLKKINVPQPVKDAGNKAGELMFLKNLIELNPVGLMKNIGSKVILDKLISEADTDQDQNMMLADVSASDINRLLGLNLYGKQKYAPNQDVDLIRMSEPGLNPTITDSEIKGVLEGTITEPTGQFATAKDGGRIGVMGGGIMGGLADGQMDEMGRHSN